jgi:hypothetical protein
MSCSIWWSLHQTAMYVNLICQSKRLLVARTRLHVERTWHAAASEAKVEREGERVAVVLAGAVLSPCTVP